MIKIKYEGYIITGTTKKIIEHNKKILDNLIKWSKYKWKIQ